MAKNFSSVTPQSVSGNTTPAKAPPAGLAPAQASSSAGSSSRRRKLLVYALGAAMVVALVVLVFGLLTRGGDDRGGAPQAPHGPGQIVDGVPSGYTRDKGGAATAAVNFMQASDAAWHGRVDITNVQKSLVAQNPTPALVAALDDAKDRQNIGDVSATLPATVTVRTISPEAADVSVWTLSAGSSSLNQAGDTSTVAMWSTTDLHLVWEDADWKVQDQAFRVGPRPGEVTQTAADPSQIESGYYSFFVN